MITSERRLPPSYYLQHFAAVLEGVMARYGDVLTATEHAYITKLQALPLPARMLYARLVNRVGPCFRRARLKYPEIEHLEAAITILCDAGLLEPCAATLPPEVMARLLGCFTLPELQAALRPHAPLRLAKPALLAWLAAWPELSPWLADLLIRHPAIRITADAPWPFLRFLFFGELRPNLSDFVTRELGHVVTETISATHLRPLFPTRAHADDAYRLATLYQHFRALRETQPALATLAWWQAQSINRDALNAGHDWHDRVIDRLGRRLEREAETEAALALYASSPSPPARERRARLLLKSGDTQSARALLQEIQAAPHDSVEAYAARQLLARLQKTARRTQACAYQQASRTLSLDYADGDVEAAVLAHYRAAGWQGVHAENWLLTACFGLLFWDIIFDATIGMFHSPLQFAPSDVSTPDFYSNRRDKIEARLALLQEPDAALALIRAHHQAKHGIANPFVGWHETLPDLLEVFVTRLPGTGLAAALRHLAQNPSRHASGLPDLFIWNDNDYRLIEIKSENDKLSGHQFEWLTVLTRAGIRAELNQITRPRNLQHAGAGLLKVGRATRERKSHALQETVQLP